LSLLRQEQKKGLTKESPLCETGIVEKTALQTHLENESLSDLIIRPFAARITTEIFDMNLPKIKRVRLGSRSLVERLESAELFEKVEKYRKRKVR